ETLQERLDMRRSAHGHFPLVAFNDIAGLDLTYARRGPLARCLASARLELIDAAPVFDAGADIGTVNAIFSEQQVSHPLERRRSVHLKIWNAVSALIPALEYEPRVVHAVVVMQMREEHMPDVDRAVSALEEAMMCARAVV